MKYRNGFVSNSSSSSFVIIGIADEKYIEDIINILDVSSDKTWDEIIEGSGVKYFNNVSGQYNYIGVKAYDILMKYNIPDACDVVRKTLEKATKLTIPENLISYIEEVDEEW